MAVLDLDLRSAEQFSEATVEPRAALVEASGSRSLGVEADLTDEEACHWAIDHVARAWGGLDLLVNIAGGAVTPYERSAPSLIPAADIRTCLDVNLMSTSYLCQAAAPVLTEAGEQGRPAAIVNTSSLSATGVLPGGMYCGYALSKAAVVHYTRSLAEELGPRGVRVNEVAPGYVMTERSGPPPRPRALRTSPATAHCVVSRSPEASPTPSPTWHPRSPAT